MSDANPRARLALEALVAESDGAERSPAVRCVFIRTGSNSARLSSTSAQLFMPWAEFIGRDFRRNSTGVPLAGMDKEQL